MIANIFSNEWGWLIVLLVVVVLFGGSRIPEVMRNLGRGKREFEKGLRGEDEDDELRREREREAEIRRRVEEEMHREGR